MNYKIIITKQYNKRVLLFFKKHPDLFQKYEKILMLLELNPFHPSLRFHKLSASLSNLYSVSINMKYRITLEFYIKDKKIIFINIGTHDEVY